MFDLWSVVSISSISFTFSIIISISVTFLIIISIIISISISIQISFIAISVSLKIHPNLSPTPNPLTYRKLAAETGLLYRFPTTTTKNSKEIAQFGKFDKICLCRSVQIWFQNMRNRKKRLQKKQQEQPMNTAATAKKE